MRQRFASLYAPNVAALAVTNLLIVIVRFVANVAKTLISVLGRTKNTAYQIKHRKTMRILRIHPCNK